MTMLKPEMPHSGMAEDVIGPLQQVVDAAYAHNPERFTHARPTHTPEPSAVWINLPTPTPATEKMRH